MVEIQSTEASFFLLQRTATQNEFIYSFNKYILKPYSCHPFSKHAGLQWGMQADTVSAPREPQSRSSALVGLWTFLVSLRPPEPQFLHLLPKGNEALI